MLLSVNLAHTMKYKPDRFNSLADKNDEILHAITLPEKQPEKLPEPSDTSDYMEMTCGRRPALLPIDDDVIYTEIERIPEIACPDYKPQPPPQMADYVEIDFDRTKLLNPLLRRCPDKSGMRRTRHDSTLSDD